MKTYTDLEQSKKLAEILPPESADMYWWCTSSRCYIEPIHIGDFYEEKGHIRAWSLAALLGILKYPLLNQDVENKWYVVDWTGNYPKSQHDDFDNHVDACYEMILKLYELKLL